MLKVRASALGQIMARPQSIDPAFLVGSVAEVAKKRTKTDDDKALLEPYYNASLSAGAKTFVKKQIARHLFGHNPEISTRYMEKGHAVEDESIELYNSVRFESASKNEERRENEWIGGTCDIDLGDKIVDIKSAWSLDTFPIFAEDAHDSGYEWQLRAYMMLWDRPKAELAFCMVDTPDYLIGYESEELHIVGHIDPFRRVTIVEYERDLALEELIKVKVTACQKYYAELANRLGLALAGAA